MIAMQIAKQKGGIQVNQNINTVESLPTFLTSKDLMNLLGVCKTTAYALCNNELASATTFLAGRYRIKSDKCLEILDSLTLAKVS